MAAARQRSSVGDAGAASVGSSSRRPASRPGGRRGPHDPARLPVPTTRSLTRFLPGLAGRGSLFSLKNSPTPTHHACHSHRTCSSSPPLGQSANPTTHNAPHALVFRRAALNARRLALPLSPSTKSSLQQRPRAERARALLRCRCWCRASPDPQTGKAPRHIPPLRQTPARHTRSHGGRRRRRAATRRGWAGTTRRGSAVWEPLGLREAAQMGSPVHPSESPLLLRRAGSGRPAGGGGVSRGGKEEREGRGRLPATMLLVV
jgi:hypothetical protein